MDFSRSHEYEKKPVNFSNLACTGREESAIIFKPEMKSANSIKKLLMEIVVFPEQAVYYTQWCWDEFECAAQCMPSYTHGTPSSHSTN